jgi:hypothetical protein
MGKKDDDVFAESQKESSDGTDGSLCASVLVIALVLCASLLVGLFIAYSVWTIVTLVESAPSKESECGRHHLMWEYSTMVSVVNPVLGIILIVIRDATQNMWLAAIPGTIGVAVTIWGIVLWSQLGDCNSYYTRFQPDLLLLFQINVVLLCISVAPRPIDDDQPLAPNSNFRYFVWLNASCAYLLSEGTNSSRRVTG